MLREALRQLRTCRRRSRCTRAPCTAGVRRTAKVYNPEAAEKAWARLLVLFKAALV